MHGKQWLNRYDSTDVRETVIERGQSRQRKLDGAIAWYFHYVMESLPLMLQTSLLLLGCALSRYLWEVNITVASVVLGITSFAVILYLLIVIAGAAFESCPYKTPGASVFRPVALYVRYRVLPTLHPAFISSRLLHVTRGSYCRALLVDWWGDFQLPWYSIRNIINPFFLLLMPIHLVADARLLGRGTLRWLVCFGGCVYRQWQLAFSWTRWLLASFGKNTYRWFTRIPQAHGLDQHAITLDLQCVSWILRTSLNKLVHLATFEHLAAMPELTRFDPALVVGCFNIFINCVSVTNDRVVTTRGFEELAAASARCFLRTFLHLSVTDPTSSTLVDLRKRYNTIFPFSTDFTGLPFCSTMTTIHLLFYRRMHFPSWNNNIWLTQERVPFSRDVVETAWAECQRMQRVKVPRRFLHFVIYSLSMDSLPSAPVVANCLIVIAIDLGCYLWHVPTLDERYIRSIFIGINLSDRKISLQTERVSSLITQKLEAMAKAADQDLIHSKRKVISALFIYLILERGRQQQMANAISRAVQVSGDRWLTWEHIKPYTPMLFRGPNTPSMDSLIVLLSPYIDWDDTLHNKDDVIRWVAAVSAVPYTEEVGRDVVGALPRIASCDSLRPYIPIEFWTWLKTHSTPPSRHPRPRIGITDDAVHYVRGLGDIDIFKSYLLLAFSEHNPVHNGFRIGYSLGEDFGGIGMWGHRKDLIERLDRVLEGCDHVDDDFEKERRVAGYDLLRRVFLQIEKEAVTTLIRTLLKLPYFVTSRLILANGNAHRISLHLRLCSPSTLPMISPHALSVFASNALFSFATPSLQTVTQHLLSLKLLCSCTRIW